MNDLTPLYTIFSPRIKILQYHHIVNIVTVKNLSNVARTKKKKNTKTRNEIFSEIEIVNVFLISLLGLAFHFIGF